MKKKFKAKETFQEKKRVRILNILSPNCNRNNITKVLVLIFSVRLLKYIFLKKLSFLTYFSFIFSRIFMKNQINMSDVKKEVL